MWTLRNSHRSLGRLDFALWGLPCSILSILWAGQSADTASSSCDVRCTNEMSLAQTTKYLYVSVHNLVFMEILKAFQDLLGVKLDGGLLHWPPLWSQKSRKASWKETQQKTCQGDKDSVLRVQGNKGRWCRFPNVSTQPTSLYLG